MNLGLIFFAALFLTIMLGSYKISAILRLIKFDQQETPKEAYLATLVMVIISILWSIIYVNS